MHSEGITLIVIFALLFIGLIFRYFQLKKREQNVPQGRIVKIIIIKEENKYFKNNDVCCICLEKMQLDNEKTLSSLICEHTFHTECLIEWLKVKDLCPICRVD